MKNKKITAIIIAAIVTVCGIVIMFACSSDSNVEKPKSTLIEDTLWGDESYGIDANVDESLSNYRTIVFYGLDNKNRSDIIMLFCLNKETNKANIVSVYRDTYMQLSDETAYTIGGKQREFFKCNHAYKCGGKYVSLKELNRHLDTNARECVGLSWDAVATLINEYGGLEVDVSEGMIPWMNTQLSDENKIQKSGKQKLNGWQTVQYLRCRKDPGADAATRAERNAKVFCEVFNTARNMGDSEKARLLDSVIKKCDTNMSRKKLVQTMDTLSTVDLENIVGWPYEYDVLWQNDYSFYYYVPETLETNVVQFHQKAFEQNDYQVSETVKNLSEQIETNRVEELVKQ